MSDRRSIRLSLCMIVKNEERFLPGCLESVKGVVDEMIIVDTGSTDATVRIAENAGAKIFTHAWTNDFAAARNVSLEKASGAWILYLDADERLKAGHGAKLTPLMKDKSAGGFILWVESDQILREGAVQRRMGYPRLFRNHPKIRFEGKVHEQIGPSIERLRMPIKMSPVSIEHLGYAQTSEIVQQKAERNLELLRVQLTEEPTNGYVQFQIGNSLDVLGRYAEAQEGLERALTLRLSDTILASVHVLLSGIAIRQDRFADGIRHAEASLLVDPQQVLARWFYGVALKGNARYAEALNAFREILASSTTAPRSANDVVIDGWKVRFHMGFCLEQVGELGDAAEQYVQVVEQYRGSEDPLNGFFRTVEKRSDVAVVLGQFKRLIACMPDHIHLRLNHALILHAVGCTDEALTELHGLEEKFPAEYDPYVVEANWMAANGSDQLQPIVERARAHEALSFPLVRLAIEHFMRNKEYSHAMALLDELIDSHTVEIPSEVRSKYVGLRQKLGALVISSQNK